jgi:hypothetical protein
MNLPFRAKDVFNNLGILTMKRKVKLDGNYQSVDT